MSNTNTDAYGNQAGNNGHNVLKGGATGAAVGGLLGHEGHHGHTGRDAALAGAGGAVLGHEHNRHHNNAGVGAGTAGGMGGMGSNQGGGANGTSSHKTLELTGKIERVVGEVIGSTRMQQAGYQKEAEAAAGRGQDTQLGMAQGLEADAQMHRGNAVGLGAHPAHGVAPNATQGGGY